MYPDDLWIGEVLKGNLPYVDPRRNELYANYGDWKVLDDPQRFIANNFQSRPSNCYPRAQHFGRDVVLSTTFSTIGGQVLQVAIPEKVKCFLSEADFGCYTGLKTLETECQQQRK